MRTEITIPEFQSAIRDYYNSYGRSFPWRETRDPYRILVSEIMLQQTQTDRVVPRYVSWLSCFPDVQSLAQASFDTVLSNWVGLGYNRRAKYLHDTAKTIAGEFDGVFPEDPQSLQKLPGVGHYTANAVSTFSFNRPNVFIETNIRSVYLFFFFSNREKVPEPEIMRRIEDTLDHDDPRTWYYALMDYGADLKKRVPNPNRQAASYTRQSRFEGSARQARGSVLRYLAREKSGTATAIANHEGIAVERILGVIPDLIREGMVHERDGFYSVGY